MTRPVDLIEAGLAPGTPVSRSILFPVVFNRFERLIQALALSLERLP